FMSGRPLWGSRPALHAPPRFEQALEIRLAVELELHLAVAASSGDRHAGAELLLQLGFPLDHPGRTRGARAAVLAAQAALDEGLRAPHRTPLGVPGGG